MFVVDLFSGTGAATQAFVDRGHKVVRIDIAGSPDIRADVRHLPIRCKPDFVWASPPCQDFSNICVRNWTRNKTGGWPEQGFETYAAACDAIAELGPVYWAIENVRGAARWWGPPTKRVGKGPNAPWLLWGNFPPFDTCKLRKGLYALYDENGRRRPGAKAKPAEESASVHYALSKALCMALERDLA